MANFILFEFHLKIDTNFSKLSIIDWSKHLLAKLIFAYLCFSLCQNKNSFPVHRVNCVFLSGTINIHDCGQRFPQEEWKFPDLGQRALNRKSRWRATETCFSLKIAEYICVSAFSLVSLIEAQDNLSRIPVLERVIETFPIWEQRLPHVVYGLRRPLSSWLLHIWCLISAGCSTLVIRKPYEKALRILDSVVYILVLLIQ